MSLAPVHLKKKWPGPGLSWPLLWKDVSTVGDGCNDGWMRVSMMVRVIVVVMV